MKIIVEGFKFDDVHSVCFQSVSVDPNHIEVSENSGEMVAAAIEMGADFISVRIIRD